MAKNQNTINDLELYRNGWGIAVNIAGFSLPIVDGSTRQDVVTSDILELTTEQFEQYINFRNKWKDYFESFGFFELFDRGMKEEENYVYTKHNGLKQSIEYYGVDAVKKLLTLNLFNDSEKNIINNMILKIGKNPTIKNIETYIYIISDLQNKIHKIGQSKNPKKRLQSIKTSNPYVQLHQAWKGVFAEEAELHQAFKNKNIKGEWFALDDNDILEIETRFSEREKLIIK